MNKAGGSWSGRLLGLAATVLLSALLLRWAYDVIRPFLNWIIVGVAVVAVGKLVVHYQRRRL
jgi:hypothetical protein